MKMEEDNVHSNICYYFIEIIYKIPFYGHYMKFLKNKLGLSLDLGKFKTRLWNS